VGNLKLANEEEIIIALHYSDCHHRCLRIISSTIHAAIPRGILKSFFLALPLASFVRFRWG